MALLAFLTDAFTTIVLMIAVPFIVAFYTRWWHTTHTTEEHEENTGVTLRETGTAITTMEAGDPIREGISGGQRRKQPSGISPASR